MLQSTGMRFNADIPEMSECRAHQDVGNGSPIKRDPAGKFEHYYQLFHIMGRDLRQYIIGI
jgi:hypothetical protein